MKRLYSLFIAALVLFAIPVPADQEQNGIEGYTCSKVYLLRLKGSINPGSSELLKRALKEAQADSNTMLLIILDTPGGLVSSLRDMVQAVMSSKIPVVVYVAPAGAQAASAGALLTLAAHVAAMAPGTNIGAAHPVGIGPGSGKEDKTMAQKAENDLAAMARSIATERGRNPKWAEDAVRSSVSASATEALAMKVIDLITRDQDELLGMLNGRVIRLDHKKVRLDLEGFQIIQVTETLRERVLRTIADPNIAYILMMIGLAGLYFEFSHPGAIFPGTIGALCLLLGLYAMQALPVSVTGLLLLALGIVLFVLEIVITSHGILGASGLVALFLGSLMLFDTSTGAHLASSVLYPTIITIGLFLSVITYLATRATLSRPKAGREALIGEKGIVRKTVGPKGGQIFVDGELWTAYSKSIIPEGTQVVVTEIDGLKLKVRPLDKTS